MELIEREPYLAQLEAYLRRAAAGRGGVVLVAGEAGVGKTALVEAFCRRLAGTAEVLQASCDALSTPGPLGPIRDLAPALGIRIDRSATDGDACDRLFRAVLEAIAARSGPIVVVGEDAHWADGATLELLRFLARRIGGLRALVVVTYRDDELGATHPLRLALGDLATASTVHRMRLPPLSEEAVRGLAAGSGRDATALQRLTGGNPFFLTEVLAADGEEVPATVGDAILARAARLSPEARAVLDVAAVLGSAVDLDLLTEVAGPVLDEIDECVARGLLRTRDDGLAFRHELTREAVLTSITLPRRRLLHARVLAALREAADADGDPALLAHHAEAAGDRAAALEFAVAAAQQAAALHAHREAAAQYARALRFANGLPDAERARLLEGRAVACHLSDQGEEAIEALQAALDIWRRRGDGPKEGESLNALSRAYRWVGRLDDAEAAGKAALAVLEMLPAGPSLAAALSNLAQVQMLTGHAEAAGISAGRALSLAERIGTPETLVTVLVNVGSARLYAGDDRGRIELDRGLQLARDAGFVGDAGRALIHLCGAMLSFMRLDEADRCLTAAIDYATKHHLDHYLWFLRSRQAIVDVHRGAWTRAVDQASRVLVQPESSPWARIMALTTLGRIRARRGDAGVATELDGAAALAEGIGALHLLGPIHAARAEAELLGGDQKRARAEALLLRDIAFQRGNRWQKGECARLLWRTGAPAAPSDDLAQPYALEIAGDWAGAAAAWRAVGCPYDEACVLTDGGDPDAVRRAIATFERLGARPALALAIRRLRELGVREVPPLRRGPRPSTRAHPAGLTRREAEVLALLAEGLRNAAIADRLYLAPKTVGHHVSAILAKLGVASRAEAAEVAARLGLIAA